MTAGFVERVHLVMNLFERYRKTDDEAKRRFLAEALRSELEGLLVDAGGIEASRGRNIEVLRAGEEERHRIARELHDGPAQNMAAVLAWTRILEASILSDPEQAVEELRQLRELAKEALDGTRAILLNLRPPILADLGLKAAVQAHLDRLQAMRPFRAEVDFSPGLEGSLGPAEEIQIFRILQEAATNAVKHAAPGFVRVAGYERNGRLVFSVRDDGKGFEGPLEEEQPARLGRHGVNSMRERAAALGGRISFERPPGGGTEVRVEIDKGST